MNIQHHDLWENPDRWGNSLKGQVQGVGRILHKILAPVAYKIAFKPLYGNGFPFLQETLL